MDFLQGRKLKSGRPDDADKGFEGWYFKHQRASDTIAFIPGRAESGAFVQVITAAGSSIFDVPSLFVDGDVIHAGQCVFSPRGCKIELGDISGEIQYGANTPLGSDIMGPFRFFPMECRHGVLSMEHSLRGKLVIDGEEHCFDGGKGYIEKDGGTSFPKSYLWLQCNDFSAPLSLMVSVADIPFCGLRFTGCICAIVHRGREYRLATYKGVRVCTAGAECVCLRQGKLLLIIDMKPAGPGHPLRSPMGGQMCGTIRESSNAQIRVRLWEDGRAVIDEVCDHAAYEYVPPSTQ